MGRLTNSKKIKLIKIEKSRVLLDEYLKRGFITTNDIYFLIEKNSNFGLDKFTRKYDYKTLVLKDIYNNPFVLCDLNNLDIKIKKLLPIFLNSKYKLEKEEIISLYNQGYLNKEECMKELDELEFCYYKSSLDGKNILKIGNAIGIVSNTKDFKKVKHVKR